jgi:D-tyrosyl-tRNA(Tyr) deacylase
MRLVVQRVSHASVSVEGQVVGSIGRGLLVLVGVAAEDGDADLAWLARKLVGLRLFADTPDGQMARSVAEISGAILLVSQFTLLASTRKGTKPSFSRAAAPQEAEVTYRKFVDAVRGELGRAVETGVFGAMMQVDLCNDGPVTLIIDSRLRE